MEVTGLGLHPISLEAIIYIYICMSYINPKIIRWKNAIKLIKMNVTTMNKS